MMSRSRLPRSRFSKWVVGATLAMTAMGCSQNSMPTADDSEIGDRPSELPQVVVTTSVLCDLTQQIAKETIDLTCLLGPGQDPHTYQTKPSDRQAIDEADLLLYDGYNFAPSVLGLIDASNNSAPKVAVFEAAVPDPLMAEAHDHAHEADEHEEAGETMDDHEEEALVADPHIWHSANNNGAIAEVIAKNLAQINPAQAELYQENSADLMATFTALDDWIAAQVKTIPPNNRKLVTTHDAFRYFANAYDIEVIGALSGLSTEERPSAQTLTSLVDQVKAAKVPTIFAENTASPELIAAIAQDADVKVADQPLFVEGPGGAGSVAETVQAMLVANTCTIVNALEGTCNEAEAPL